MEDSEKRRFKSVLKRSNFEFEELDQSSIIQGIKFPKSTVNLYLYFSITIMIIGVLGLLFLSWLIGVIMLSSSIPLFNKVSKLKKREKNNKGKSVEINSNSIVVRAKNGTNKLDREKIKELSFDVEKDKDISSAILFVTMNDETTYELIEIFGDNKRYVEDDMKIISDYVVKILND